MSGMTFSSGSDFGKLMLVRQQLKEIDTILYELTRDFRVSGFYIDNKQVRESCRGVFELLDEINKKVHVIFDEACKNHITGEHEENK